MEKIKIEPRISKKLVAILIGLFAFGEDIGFHFGIPNEGLISEMYFILEQLLHTCNCIKNKSFLKVYYWPQKIITWIILIIGEDGKNDIISYTKNEYQIITEEKNTCKNGS